MKECVEIPPERYSGRVIRVGEWVGKRERNKVVIRDMERSHHELGSGTAPGEHKVELVTSLVSGWGWGQGEGEQRTGGER